MATTVIDEKRPKLTVSKGDRRYTRWVRIRSDTPITLAQAELACPMRGAAMYFAGTQGSGSFLDVSARLQDIDITEQQHLAAHWRGVLKYSSKAGDESEQDEDPTAQPPKYAWSSNIRTVTWVRDRDDVAIVNTAGDIFNPAITEPVSFSVLTVTRNVAQFNVAQAEQYQDAISTDEILNRAAGRARVQSYDASEELQGANGAKYVQARIAIELMPSRVPGTFETVIPNIGWHEMETDANGKTGRKIMARDDEGNYVQLPVFLKTDGTRLPQGEPPTLDNGGLIKPNIHVKRSLGALQLF